MKGLRAGMNGTASVPQAGTPKQLPALLLSQLLKSFSAQPQWRRAGDSWHCLREVFVLHGLAQVVPEALWSVHGQ